MFKLYHSVLKIHDGVDQLMIAVAIHPHSSARNNQAYALIHQALDRQNIRPVIYAVFANSSEELSHTVVTQHITLREIVKQN